MHELVQHGAKRILDIDRCRRMASGVSRLSNESAERRRFGVAPSRSRAGVQLSCMLIPSLPAQHSRNARDECTDQHRQSCVD